MVSEPAASSRPAIRLHWRSGRVRSVTVPAGLAAVVETVGTLTGPLLQPLPATQGVVGSAAPAVNDAMLTVPTVAAGRWRRWLVAIAAIPGQALRRLARARGPAVPVARIGRGWHGERALSRWPAAWPYADAGLGGGSNCFPGSGADYPSFAPDVIVDNSGRILRL